MHQRRRNDSEPEAIWILVFFIALLGIGLLAGCGGVQVERLAPERTTDLGGYWNDSDARIVAEGLSSSAARAGFPRTAGRPPVVIVGSFRNQGHEAVVMSGIERWIETELVRAGNFTVVAASMERGEIRRERREQQAWARPETRSELVAETGANYLMQGILHSWEDRAGRERVRVYRVDAYLVHIETNERVWAGSEMIKKSIQGRWIGL